MLYSFIKRFFDLIFVIIVLIIISPVLIVVAIILSFTGERKVFYFQKRIGYKNKPFMIWKFATMKTNSSKMGSGFITLRNDRATKFGKILRISKINELPQIINVILGDLSLVGPRPLMEQSFKNYDKFIRHNIYNIKPGITGIGSIIFRDEELLISNVVGINPHDFYRDKICPLKGELEMWYQKNYGFFTDLKILFVTAWTIVFKNSNIFKYFFRNLPDRNF